MEYLVYGAYRSIKDIVTDLKDKEGLNSEIYCINCTNDDIRTKYGLKNIISSGQDKHYMKGDNETAIADAFKDIASSVTITDINHPDRTTSGTIKLDQISNIKAIKVGGTALTPEQFGQVISVIEYQEEDTGILNLNDERIKGYFQTRGNITIEY